MNSKLPLWALVASALSALLLGHWGASSAPVSPGYVPIVVKPAEVELEEPADDRFEALYEDGDGDPSLSEGDESFQAKTPSVRFRGSIERVAGQGQLRCQIRVYQLNPAGRLTDMQVMAVRTLTVGVNVVDYDLVVPLPPRARHVESYLLVAEVGAGQDHFVSSAKYHVRRRPLAGSPQPIKLNPRDSQGKLSPGYVPIVVVPIQSEVEADSTGQVTLKGVITRAENNRSDTVFLRVYRLDHAEDAPGETSFSFISGALSSVTIAAPSYTAEFQMSFAAVGPLPARYMVVSTVTRTNDHHKDGALYHVRFK
jgi:hypothetical protein